MLFFVSIKKIFMNTQEMFPKFLKRLSLIIEILVISLQRLARPIVDRKVSDSKFREVSSESYGLEWGLFFTNLTTHKNGVSSCSASPYAHIWAKKTFPFQQYSHSHFYVTYYFTHIFHVIAVNYKKKKKT